MIAIIRELIPYLAKIGIETIYKLDKANKKTNKIPLKVPAIFFFEKGISTT